MSIAVDTPRYARPVLVGRGHRSRRPGTASPRRPIRLNRRGRIVVGAGAVVIVAALILTVGGLFGVLSGALWEAPAEASATSTSLNVDHVRVREGQTLWQIASSAAPHADPRETILQIEKLNDLPNSAVQAGQKLAIPRY